jgi:hypothetical protein
MCHPKERLTGSARVVGDWGVGGAIIGNGFSAKAVLRITISIVAALCWPVTVHAQGTANQFGGQDRANAAQRMIVLAVQQEISSLPPTSGQAVSYEFDLKTGEPVKSKYLGPTAFLSTQTVGAGNLSVRLATSYFDLADSFGPIPYRVQFDEPFPGEPQPPKGVVKFGLNAGARVGVINLAANYGVTSLEVTMNLPIVIVDAHASDVFSSPRAELSLPPQKAHVGGPPIVNDDVGAALRKLDDELHKSDGLYVLREETFSALGFQFNEGTHAGVGRISIGAKGLVYSDKRLQLAVAPEFFFPSPSQDEFAGSDSASILPRIVGAFRVVSPLTLHVDSGYDCDFDNNELRRFVWNVGASIALGGETFDAGIGGSKYNQGIEWTPTIVKGAGTLNFPPSTGVALGNNTLGDSFVDFLAGIKFRITDNWVISGTVDVPVNDQGFRPAAAGTLAVEYYFLTPRDSG